MTFIWPSMLFTLVLIPILVGAYFRLVQKRKQLSTDLGPLGMVQNSSGINLGARRHTPALIFVLGLTLLLFSLSRPEMMVDLPRIEGTVILAFDVSNSMAASDLEPSRMEAAKNAARTFVENQPSTIQLGVVAFSNGGLVVQSPTNDQTAILTTIDRLVPQGATSLGHGIFTALNAIAGEAIAIEPEILEDEVPQLEVGPYPSAVVILMTDGEDTSSTDPLEVAQLAADAGVRIYTVGIGSPEGTVIQVDGYNVLTRLDEPTLEGIASLTNGAYYRAADEETLQEIYENVDLQLTVSGDTMEVTALFAGLSVLLFILGGGLSLVWFGRMPI